MKGNMILAGCAALLLMGCAGAFRPREGDLLFQLAGSSAMSSAIADATAQADSMRFVHVAIVISGDSVVEASPDNGVSVVALSEFLKGSPAVAGRPGVVVKRVSVDFPLGASVRRALEKKGQPYDWSYLPGNGKMYCSELVYDSYRYADGMPLFAMLPMNFLDAEGRLPDFWERLFDRLGEPVPQGVPGTNPTDMSRSPLLREVHRYF